MSKKNFIKNNNNLYFSKEIKKIKHNSQFRNLIKSHRYSNSKIFRNGKELISFSCNDYLGLSQNKTIISASIQALKEYGTGAGASRLVSGNHPLYNELENLITKFKNVESTCVFGSGFLTNTGVIPAVSSKDDLIIYDELSHASTNLGIKLSKAKSFKFKHNDVNHVENICKKHRNRYNSCFILTEGVFSMDGDKANLKEISFIAEKFNASIILDDAHGFGVLGKGRGSQYDLKPIPEIFIQIGTLSKAVGSYGGFTVSPKIVNKLIHNKARTLIYTTGLPPSCVAASIAAINIIRSDKNLVKKPLMNASLFCEKALLAPPQSSIVTLILGTEQKTIKASKLLEKEGFYVGAIRPPTVPLETSRLRFTFCANHKKNDIIKLANIVKNITKTLL
ncbi:MAG: 8-amino-7-oxononanoate synthase [Alphaproteobacteria bacterium MarineAlpha9_Bin1]|mgnify:FL=1|nr:MAG: 8-amino-7-oxononanoate synthase [Alphaproteobacteria bacterium MarineAlpha9_Bin1]